MKRRLASHPAYAVARGKSTTQLIHDRGPPFVIVAGEQEHGGACVSVDNIETKNAFKMERYLRASRAGSAERRPSGQKWTDTNFVYG